MDALGLIEVFLAAYGLRAQQSLFSKQTPLGRKPQAARNKSISLRVIYLIKREPPKAQISF
jgi:hypothetical protein